MKIIFIYVALLLFLGANKNCENSTESLEQSQLLAKENELALGCKNDEDCDAIAIGCCDCRRGGKQKAILKSKIVNELKALEVKCADVMCAQMISKDESCKKSAACSNNICVLK